MVPVITGAQAVVGTGISGIRAKWHLVPVDWDLWGTLGMHGCWAGPWLGRSLGPVLVWLAGRSTPEGALQT